MVRPIDPKRAAARREQIMEAAIGCFRARGFQQTSIADICAAASLSPGAVYRYFSSKDVLIGAIMEQHVAVSLSQVAEACDGITALRHFAETMLCEGQGCDEMRLRAEIFAEARRRPDFMRQVAHVRDLARNSLAGLIAKAQATGEFRAGLDPNFAAAGLVCVLDGLTFQAMTSCDDARTAEAAINFFEQVAREMLAESKPAGVKISNVSAVGTAVHVGLNA